MLVTTDDVCSWDNKKDCGRERKNGEELLSWEEIDGELSHETGSPSAAQQSQNPKGAVQ